MLRNTLRKAFRTATSIYDPIVRRTVHGAPMLLPLSHGLPRCVKAHPYYDTPLPAIARYLKETIHHNGGLGIVDVGANVGDTACILRAAVGDNMRLICVEGDSTYIPLLEKNAASFSEVVCCLLGDEDGTVNASMADNRAGTSSVVLGGTHATKMRKLDSLLQGEFKAIHLIKIDTDGFEVSILKGGSEFFRATSAMCFMEFSPWHLRTYGGVPAAEPLELMSSFGYTGMLVYDNTGYPVGVYELNKETIENVATYCSVKPSFYVDILFSKNLDMIKAFYAEDEKRYSAADWGTSG